MQFRPLLASLDLKLCRAKIHCSIVKSVVGNPSYLSSEFVHRKETANRDWQATAKEVRGGGGGGG